jgi:hypothetical protein
VPDHADSLEEMESAFQAGCANKTTGIDYHQIQVLIHLCHFNQRIRGYNWTVLMTVDVSDPGILRVVLHKYIILLHIEFRN